jgi:hypothetical protein
VPDDQRTSSIRRWLRFSLRQLFVVVALVAVGLGVWSWIPRNVVVVRAATQSDKVSGEEYLSSRRNVAVVTSELRFGAWLLAELHLVQAGTVLQIHYVGLARRSWDGLSLDAAPRWSTSEFRLALGDSIEPAGRRTEVYFAGDMPSDSLTFSGPNMLNHSHSIKAVTTETLPARIISGRRQVVYVEGDQKCTVDRTMTVEEFAKANSGNYLVVTIELR